MTSYLIKVNYEDMDSDLICIKVPAGVRLTFIKQEMRTLRDLFYALRYIDDYDNTDDCITSYICDEMLPRAKAMFKELFPDESQANDVFANEGANAKTLFGYLCQLHKDWQIDNSVATLEFDFDN